MVAPEKNQTKSTGRGGARPGAGRKAGSANVKTREIADRAAVEGITPLEVMLFAMRATMAEAEAVIEDQRLKGAEQIAMPLGLLADAAALAKDAAPYIHPRLQSTTIKGDEENPLTHVLRFADAETLRQRVRGTVE